MLLKNRGKKGSILERGNVILVKISLTENRLYEICFYYCSEKKKLIFLI